MLFVTAAALVDADGRVLLAERPAGKPMAGLWEFPGGKVHADETPELALVRELKEELGITTSVSCLSPAAFVTYPLNPDSHLPDQFTEHCEGCNPLNNNPQMSLEDILLMLLYVVRRWDGIVHPNEGQKVQWVYPKQMLDFPMPPADLPLVTRLRDLL